MSFARPFPRTSISLMISGAFAALCVFTACGQGDTAVKAPDPQGKSLPAVTSSSVAPEIQTAVETYLREGKGLDPTKMNIALSNFVEAEGGATCSGAITLKEGEGMPAMEYTYTFSKVDGAWKVTASQPKGGVGHATMPPASAMPAGHPSVGGADPHAGVPGAPPLQSSHTPATPSPAGETPKK